MVASVSLDTILCTKKCLACTIMRTFSSLASNKCSVLQINCVISSVLMMRIVKTVVFWVVTLCSLWKMYCLFRGSCSLQVRCSFKGMGGGGLIGPVVNRKCQDALFSLLLFHIFYPFFYSPYQAIFLLPIPWLWLAFFFKPFCINRWLPHPFHFSVIFDLICLLIYLNLYLKSGKFPCKEIQTLLL